MKKLLFLVLIAIAFCVAVENVDADVEAWSLKGIWDKVKGAVSSAVSFLKKYGIWDAIKTALSTAGTTAAGIACQNVGVPGVLCSTMVKIVADNM